MNNLIVDFDEEAMKSFVKDATTAMERAMEYAAIELQSNVEKLSPVDEGKLQGNWDREQQKVFDWIVYTNTKYAKMVDEGTGVYGETGQPITAKNGGVLAFQIDGKTIFCKSIKGQQGSNYSGRAVEATQQRLSEFMQMAIDSIG